MNPKIRKYVIAALVVLTLAGVVFTTSIRPASHEGASADPVYQEEAVDQTEADHQEEVVDQSDVDRQETASQSEADRQEGAADQSDVDRQEAAANQADADRQETAGQTDQTDGEKGDRSDSSDKNSASSMDGSKSTSKNETKTITCTLTIDCSLLIDESILQGTGNENKQAYVPSNGKIASGKSVKIRKGSSVYDVLKKYCKARNIQMEASFTPGLDTYYVEGINHLYEFDGGEGSGWVFFVNGQSPNYGASDITVEDGDEIVWMYTLDYGNDVSP